VPGQPNPGCIVVVAPGDSLGAIVDRINDAEINTQKLAVENGIVDVDVISAGMELDICPNGFDDKTGAERVPPPTVAPSATAPVPTTPQPVEGLASGVPAQQQKLNELFAPLGMRPLEVDGVSGRMTRQLLCAARLALGMPVSRDDMAPGSPEEQSLMAATGLQIPPGAPVHAGRWGLIDQHCQVMFVGEGSNRVVFVFPTSTGTAEFPTRDQDASRSFRYDPAPENGGWHDSSDYPASVDNPLNGNMYKPIYFDGGQAIHGANTVPTSPASHGCARLRVPDQDTLVSWLGLADVDRQLWDAAGRIDFTVTIAGRY
jgi:lipoprotein-anchoring transpeptidase ErfK/SrfK